jgi:predicted XRE-type DNA-binding protein
MKTKAYIEVKNVKDLCKALGLPSSLAPKVELRRDLVMAIKEAIAKKRLTHAEAADKVKIGRTIVTAIVNGNIGKISTDRLMDVATQLGLKFHLEIAA